MEDITFLAARSKSRMSNRSVGFPAAAPGAWLGAVACAPGAWLGAVVCAPTWAAEPRAAALASAPAERSTSRRDVDIFHPRTHQDSLADPTPTSLDCTKGRPHWSCRGNPSTKTTQWWPCPVSFPRCVPVSFPVAVSFSVAVSFPAGEDVSARAGD